jgi:arylsulfatase A-like enzyme
MKKPNFLVIVTDDQGYGDLSCMGTTDFITPNFDRLAGQGVRFTDWYANSPVCSPSRASLLSGCYPAKTGVRDILKGDRATQGLRSDIPLLSTELQKLGYRTGLFGKWHLGSAPESRPENCGFDEWLGFLSGNIDYYSHIFYYGVTRGVNPTHDLWENGREVFYNGRYMTDLITERSTGFIRDCARKKQPFFLYSAFNAPHYPMHAPAEHMDRFGHLPWDRQIMAAMLAAADDGIGMILNELERQRLLEDTCILFFSDNGPSRESRNWMDGTPDYYYGGTTGKLRGHKGSLFDGGIRVPAIMSWKGTLPEGTVCNQMACNADVLPTFLSLAGVEKSETEFDGKNIFPMLAGPKRTPHSEIFWEMPDQDNVVKGLREQLAVRQGPWKLVLNGWLVEGLSEADEVFLSNLDDDIAERNNLKNEYPEKAAELTDIARDWSSDMNRAHTEINAFRMNEK